MSSYLNTRFTLMAFPNKVHPDGKLDLNILFIPRNINPLVDVKTIFSSTGITEPFASERPGFNVVVSGNPDEFPGKFPPSAGEIHTEAVIGYSDEIGSIFKVLSETKDSSGNHIYFKIDDQKSSDSTSPNRQAAPNAVEKSTSVRKYLPTTYRNAFNFTAPRTPNAVIDDSYHCAMREKKDPVPFVKEDTVSWGKVFAYLLKNPLLAKKAGFLYETSIQLKPGELSKGGWIHAELYNCAYATVQATSLTTTDGPFIKCYAARIPILKPGTGGKPFEGRNLFASVLFPVMNPGQDPDGIFDEVFLESATFDEGFATIVHANQPVSQNLLKEEQDGLHPQKDVGIRLGWEDEQILVWYMRQISKDESATAGRLDAPLGVNGYHIDVREEGKADWESLNRVASKDALSLEKINLGTFEGELPYQVFPSKSYDGNKEQDYWLPMYFANWNNHSLVLPDNDGSELYGIDHDNECIDPEKTATDGRITRKVNTNSPYKAVPITARLRYGGRYQFRVRMCDIAGGGPLVSDPLPDDTLGRVCSVHFKRYVAPHSLDFEVPENPEDKISFNSDDINFSGNRIAVKRPLLGYPAVVYTDKYTDCIEKLIDIKNNVIAKGLNQVIGLPDPDVDKVEITVEVESLQMDNLASISGRDNYIPLYTTYRYFDTDYESSLNLTFEYRDEPVLKLLDSNPFSHPGDNATIIATKGKIILPTSRNIRLTLRPVSDGDKNYWNVNNDGNKELDSRYGKKTVLYVRSNALNEYNIISGENSSRVLQGIYLQPDPVSVKLNPFKFKTLTGNNEGMPDIVQRLAKQLDIEAKELTLLSKNGERVVFWCSNFIRHSMSPDSSSITFSGKNELTGHWLVCSEINLNRDWTWDGFEHISFGIKRRKCFGSDNDLLDAVGYYRIGDLEIKRIASFQAIQSGEDNLINRASTRIILIDAIDPKPFDDGAAGHDEFYPFPECMLLQYKLTPHFKEYAENKLPDHDKSFVTAILELPITINPKQTPKLLGAGIALSPYLRDERYSSTEPRKRQLWLEFERNAADEKDDLFCRVLAYAPDQLISNNHPDLMEVPEESPLTLDPEYIRVVIPESSHDQSGLNAMQLMEKSIDDQGAYYLLPIPPGLHPESPELFGMFTYEFRFGHSGRTWSTAQGRFGRALRVAGIQHPAPTLLCMVQHDQERITVSAPFAKSVFKGRNVTSKPPRTSLWCLLYAQVKQADGKDYRNILLNVNELKKRNIEDEIKKLENEIALLDYELKRGKKKDSNMVMILKEQMIMLQKQIEMLPGEIRIENETGIIAYGSWLNAEVNNMLSLYGLPADSPLSVVCVEIFGQITNIFDHINNIQEYDHQHSGKRVKEKLISRIGSDFSTEVANEMHSSLQKLVDYEDERFIDPLNSQLGFHRILRTSPLTEVPKICCTEDCE